MRYILILFAIMLFSGCSKDLSKELKKAKATIDELNAKIAKLETTSKSDPNNYKGLLIDAETRTFVCVDRLARVYAALKTFRTTLSSPREIEAVDSILADFDVNRYPDPADHIREKYRVSPKHFERITSGMVSDATLLMVNGYGVQGADPVQKYLGDSSVTK